MLMRWYVLFNQQSLWHVQDYGKTQKAQERFWAANKAGGSYETIFNSTRSEMCLGCLIWCYSGRHRYTHTQQTHTLSQMTFIFLLSTWQNTERR